MAKRLNVIIPVFKNSHVKHQSIDSKDITSVKYRSDVKCTNSEKETPSVDSFEVSGSADTMNLDVEICAVCFKTFTSDEYLMQHMEVAHPLDDDSVVGCIICYEEFESFKSLMEHIKQHPNSCDKCQLNFTGHKHLLLHYRKVHAKNIGRKHKTCPECKAKFDSKNGYMEHMARRHNNKICSKIKGKKNSTPLALSKTDNNVNKLKNGASPTMKNQKINEKISDQKSVVEDVTHRSQLPVKDLASSNKIISESNLSKLPQNNASTLSLKTTPANARCPSRITDTVKKLHTEGEANGVCISPPLKVDANSTPPKSCEKKVDCDADKKLCGSASKKVFVESPDFAASLCPTLESLSTRPKVLKTGNILPELLNLSASQRKSKRVIKKFEKSLHDLESSITSKSVSSPQDSEPKKIESTPTNSNFSHVPETSSSPPNSEPLNIDKSNSAMKVSCPSNSESKKIGKATRPSDSSITSEDTPFLKTEPKKVLRVAKEIITLPLKSNDEDTPFLKTEPKKVVRVAKEIIALPLKSNDVKKIEKSSKSLKLTQGNSSVPSKSEVKLIDTSPDHVEPALVSEIVSLPSKPESVKQRLSRAVMAALPAKFLSKSVDEIAPVLKLNASSGTAAGAVSKKPDISSANLKPDHTAQSTVTSQVTLSAKSEEKKRPKRKSCADLSWKSLYRKKEQMPSKPNLISSSEVTSLPANPTVEKIEVSIVSTEFNPVSEPTAESEVNVELGNKGESKVNLESEVHFESEVNVVSENAVESSTSETSKRPKRNIIVSLPSKSLPKRTLQVPSNCKPNHDSTSTDTRKAEISPSSSEPDMVFEVSLSSTPESQTKLGANRKDQQVRFTSNNDLEKIEEKLEDNSNQENPVKDNDTKDCKEDMILELKRRVSMELSRKLQSLGVTKDSLDSGTTQSCSLILPCNTDSAKNFSKNDKKIVSMEQCIKEYESKNKPAVVTKKSAKKRRRPNNQESQLVAIPAEENDSEIFEDCSDAKPAAKKMKPSKSRKQALSVMKDIDSVDNSDEPLAIKFEKKNSKNSKSCKLVEKLDGCTPPTVKTVAEKNPRLNSKKRKSTKISKNNISAEVGVSENISDTSASKSSRSKQVTNEIKSRKRKASETNENMNHKLSKTLSSSHGNSMQELPSEVQPSVDINESESELLSQSLPKEIPNAEPSKKRNSARVIKNNPIDKQAEEFQEEDLLLALIDNFKQIKQSSSNEETPTRGTNCPYCKKKFSRITALQGHLKFHIFIQPDEHRSLILDNPSLLKSTKPEVENSISTLVPVNPVEIAVVNDSAKERNFDDSNRSSILTSTPYQTNDHHLSPLKAIDDSCPTPRRVCKVSPKVRNLNETVCDNSFSLTNSSKSPCKTSDSNYFNGITNGDSGDFIDNVNFPSEPLESESEGESESNDSEYSSIINSQPYVLLDDIGHLLPSVYEKQSRENSDAENTPPKLGDYSVDSAEKSYVDEVFPEKEVVLETVCALCQEKFGTNADLMAHIVLHF